MARGWLHGGRLAVAGIVIGVLGGCRRTTAVRLPTVSLCSPQRLEEGDGH